MNLWFIPRVPEELTLSSRSKSKFTGLYTPDPNTEAVDLREQQVRFIK
jgi:hypothetical protein